MTTSRNPLLEQLENEGYLFYIKVEGFEGAGTLLKKEGVYTYMPERRRGFEISYDRILEILKDK